jgi:hypothetical protein
MYKLSAGLEKDLSDIDEWLTRYISKPHSQLGRSGAVCPFVAPSRNAGCLEVRLCVVGVTPSVDLLSEMVRCGLSDFHRVQWPASNSQLWSMLLVFPDLAEESLGVLDEAHAAMKPECVRRGFMIGQFHEYCTEKAARNPEFEVSRSPVPLMAIRMMAVHDVLFLGDRKEWFEEYVSRFGDRYRKAPENIDPVLYDAYTKACAEHGISA